MKKWITTIVVLCFTVIIAGCSTSPEVTRERITADEVNLTYIQKAVDEYREKTGGLLPIKNKDQVVDKYIKYPIDFEKLTRDHYIDVLPNNSFEKGGIYQYVIWHAESKNPVVKLIDLQQAEIIRDLVLKKTANGFVPIGEHIIGNYYYFNYKKMGYKSQPVVKSPYSNVNLPIILKGTGEFFVDYSIDLQKIVTEKKPILKKNQDIRFLLEEKHPILPAYSTKYIVNSAGDVEIYDDFKK
ncbi:hypothetical protein [Kurthia sibirica]|uniref:Lipoprotein n=1 Tax=Kurthia sibirica TaxID=202750 RepID=A0A2U3AIQ8_9BACL|nr:hypothetical protein [Kurthia sibirica]PWI24433.1 hypothetical protein DEX24_13270 [Kurthia sibirica]GEK35182.1 hypothetical protein KSI01_27150 [Kurthia sibirica]